MKHPEKHAQRWLMPRHHHVLMGVLLVLVIGAGGLSACQPIITPEQVVFTYLQARTTGDADTMRRLACAEWEAQSAIEATTFVGYAARLEDVLCLTEQQNETTVVARCQGQIVVNYDGEDSAFALGNYRLINEDGGWKMCGETDES